MDFISPTKGRLTFDEMFADIISFVQEEPDASYRLIIGTDSQLGDETCFVTAIIIYRRGKGARYYYHRDRKPFSRNLRQRIYYETARSLGVASQMAERLAENGHSDLDVEIHLDVGENGSTRDLIREVVGMVVGSGFDARIKPDSYGASKVADKYTK
ncbi:MAG: ribonuclease H-like YkuK family protein [Limnochordaceae bacterium]|nr:ribonuclease H-like YkuK family protein [Limnochordaceae bacterium]